MPVDGTGWRVSAGGSTHGAPTFGQWLTLVLVLMLPTAGAAQTADSAADVAVARAPPTSDGPSVAASAGRDGWHLELTGELLRESWDVNQSREELIGGAISLHRHLLSSWAVGVEASLLHVHQDPVDDVLVPTLSLMLRWSAFRVGETSVFFEGGGGLSYATGVVPHGGTRLNLVSRTGVGIVRPVSSRVSVVGGLGWFHLSNNSLNGRDHNPDIQALGLYVGWRVAYQGGRDREAEGRR